MAIRGDEPTRPISVRLTVSELESLKRQAGSRPVSDVIRSQIFERPVRRQALRVPKQADREIAQLLAELGRSQVASALLEMAEAVRIGALPVDPETQKALKDACKAVLEMRRALFEALGLDGDVQ